ncbi:hypothetical protein [Clostridium sp. 19966]
MPHQHRSFLFNLSIVTLP